MNDVLVIVGPTASGKTRAAVELARRIGAVIVGADARQVYRGFDVATGKEGEPMTFELRGLGSLPARTLDGVPQLGLDFVGPTERFTVAQWAGWADRVLEALEREGVPGIVAGGTPLYVEALVRGFRFPGARPPDRRYRILGLDPPREVLRGRVQERLEAWFHGDALRREVEARLRDGVPTDAEPFTAIGYAEAVALRAGRMDRDAAVRAAYRRTWDYTRRQRSYFRGRFPEAEWRSSENPNMLLNAVPTATGTTR